ncbi:MAG: hypothetical protein RJA07_1969 [Bacteroidota bacterium]|jgi:hypothetical protein
MDDRCKIIPQIYLIKMFRNNIFGYQWFAMLGDTIALIF